MRVAFPLPTIPTVSRFIKAPAFRKLDICTEALWLLLIFALPLWFNPWGQQPFYLAKSLLLQVIVSLLLGLALAGWWLRPREIRHFSFRHVVKTRPLQAAVLLLVCSWIISTAFSIMQGASFWGSLGRQWGLLTLISWAAFFFIVSLKVSSLSQVYRALTVLVASSAAVAVIAILQGIDIGVLTQFTINGRVSSTDGNPLSLSGFVAMSMPLDLALVLITWLRVPAGKARNLKLAGLLVVFFLQAVCLYLAQYAVTILLFVVGTFFFLLLAGLVLKRKVVAILSAASLAALLLLAIVVVGQLAFSKSANLSSQKSDADTVAGTIGLNTMERRFSTWASTVSILVDRPEMPAIRDRCSGLRPFIGYGPESFMSIMQARYPRSLASRDIYVSYLIDQPENQYLYLAVTNGWLGLSAFILVLLAFFYISLRMLRRGVNDMGLLAAAFAAGIMQYCVYLLFVPAAALPDLVFWLLLSLSAALYAFSFQSGDYATAASACGGSQPCQAGLMRKILAAVVIAASIAGAAVLVGNTLLADMKLRTAILAWPGDMPRAMDRFIEAADLDEREAVYAGHIGSRLFSMAISARDSKAKQDLLEQSVQWYQRAIKNDPYLAYWHYRAGDVYAYAAQDEPGNWDRAIQYYSEADALLPHNAVIMNKLALALMGKGEYKQAGFMLDESAADDPDWAQTDLFRALLTSYLGDYKQAGEAMLKPVRDKFSNIDYFADLCLQTVLYGGMENVRYSLKSYTEDNPGDWLGQAMLSMAAAFSLRSEEASAALLKSASIVPDSRSQDMVSIAEAVGRVMPDVKPAADEVIRGLQKNRIDK